MRPSVQEAPRRLFYGAISRTAGGWAWVLHRITGVALVFYLFLHVFVTSTLTSGPELFNKVMRLFEHPAFGIGESLLLAALVFHGLNGIRILLVDFFAAPAKVERPLFWCVLALSVVFFAFGAYPILAHAFGAR